MADKKNKSKASEEREKARLKQMTKNLEGGFQTQNQKKFTDEDIPKTKKEDSEDKNNDIDDISDKDIEEKDADELIQRGYYLSKKHTDLLQIMKLKEKLKGKDKTLSQLIMEGIDLLYKTEFKKEE
jgi:hypothetical protein